VHEQRIVLVDDLNLNKAREALDAAGDTLHGARCTGVARSVRVGRVPDYEQRKAPVSGAFL
jgi:hypothetical protein